MRVFKLTRAVSTALLALGVLQPATAAATAGWSRAPHACEDHACFCRKPASGTPPAPCHGTADEDAPRLVAACSHDADPATLAPVRPGLLPVAVLSSPADPSRPLAEASGAASADGFHPIESPPPRPARSPRA
jgi:hypothetical protein